ncbi:phospholipase-like protein [Tanacetum coccineum]|uniref:Phospholipase-like protein n=1 Tax=Tanacetum coccineum TaxID=301880 RepID=A0ABQ5J1F1_9ASTR
MEEWVKKLQENAKINTRNQRASLKNLETQIKQLTKEFHAKTANEIPNSSVGQCKAVYANNEAPIDNTSSNETNEVSFIANNKAQVVQETKVLSCQLLPKELNPGSFTLPYTIGSLNFYVMADLGASVNVIPKSMFEHVKLTNLKKTDMLVEMVDMTKRVPTGIVENVIVKIDKFLFPSDFVVIEMINTRNETMILGRPFLSSIHAEIDVFNKEISLGIGDDRATFDMDKKIHNFTTLVGKIYMVNSIHKDESSTSNNALSYKSPQFEKSNNMHHENNNDNYMQERSSKKARMLKPDTNIASTHFCKLVKQNCNGILKKKHKWDCLSFLDFLLVRYGNAQGNDLIWDSRLRDYPFKEWLLTKAGHIDISEPVKKALLKSWLIDSFREELVKDPRSRSFDDYKWMFDLEIDQLADEYELGIGKKGHMLEYIWENCKKVQVDNTYWWHDHGLEKNERQESGLDIKEYDLPDVHVETFEVKRYSFNSGHGFICVTKEIGDTLPLGRENGSRFGEMIRKEVDTGRKA